MGLFSKLLSCLGSNKQEPEIEDLCTAVANTGYIDNLRVGNNWILGQMVKMGCNSKGVFDEDRYYAALGDLYPSHVWRQLLRQLNGLSHCTGISVHDKSKWWTKDVALAVAKSNYELLQKGIEFALETNSSEYCTGGPYVTLHIKDKKMFFINDPKPGSKWNSSNSTTLDELRNQYLQHIKAIEDASDYQELYKAALSYSKNQYSPYVHYDNRWPEEFINAYAGYGAYNAMLIMASYFEMTYNDCNGNPMTVDQCLDDITQLPSRFDYDGRKLLSFCKEHFFDNPDRPF